MKCKNPYFKDVSGRIYGPGQGTGGAVPFGCGQCMGCRINKTREWQHRMMLEAMAHKQSAFVTLTFDEEHVPEKVTVRELQLFLKRFRKSYGSKIRYFGVGEYGDKYGRPHYHLAIFGVNDSWICPKCDKHNCPNIEKKKNLRCEYQGKQMCLQEEIMPSWTKGIVQVGEINKDSAGYIAGYVAKGNAHKKTAGEKREFAIQSRKPGLGHDTVVEVAREMSLVPENQLVSSFVYGKGSRPLGRYLTRVLMEARGQDDSVLKRALSLYEDEVMSEICEFEFPFEVYRNRAAPAVDAAERRFKNYSRRTL